MSPKLTDVFKTKDPRMDLLKQFAERFSTPERKLVVKDDVYVDGETFPAVVDPSHSDHEFWGWFLAPHQEDPDMFWIDLDDHIEISSKELKDIISTGKYKGKDVAEEIGGIA